MNVESTEQDGRPTETLQEQIYACRFSAAVFFGFFVALVGVTLLINNLDVDAVASDKVFKVCFVLNAFAAFDGSLCFGYILKYLDLITEKKS